MVSLAVTFAPKPESSRVTQLSSKDSDRVQLLLSSLVSWRHALGLISALTILTASSFSGLVLAKEPPLTPTAPSSALSATTSTLQQPNSSVESGLAAGTYLFGDSAQSGVVGHQYLIFQVTSDHRVVGASFAPYSSFDCFHGQERGMNLELMVRDSYSQTQTMTAIPLSELKPIPTIGLTDQQLLNTCLSNAPQKTEASRPLLN